MKNNLKSLDNLALVLGGGAARGAFHLGFLHFCEEQNINISAYSGSSIGSIISVSHASGIKAKEQLKIFASKDAKEALKFNYFKNGLLRINENHNIIKELLPYENLEDLEKPVYVTAYDLKKRELHYFNKGNARDLCMGSSALVPIFKPIKYENMYLIDGGLFDNIPIKPLLNQDYTILSIDLFPYRTNFKNKRISLLRRLKKLILKQLYENHKFSINNTHQYIGIMAIREFSLFTFSELNECFNLGFKEAQKHFLDIL